MNRTFSMKKLMFLGVGLVVLTTGTVLLNNPTYGFNKTQGIKADESTIQLSAQELTVEKDQTVTFQLQVDAKEDKTVWLKEDNKATIKWDIETLESLNNNLQSDVEFSIIDENLVVHFTADESKGEIFNLELEGIATQSGLIELVGETENGENSKAAFTVTPRVATTTIGNVEVKLDATIDDYKTLGELPFEALDEEGELDGFTRMQTNEPIPLENKLNDGRKYYTAFGQIYNYRLATDTKTNVGSVKDSLYQSFPTDDTRTLSINNVPRLATESNSYSDGVVPLLGSQVAVLTKPNGVQNPSRWATYAYQNGMGMGSYKSGYSLAIDQAKDNALPIISKMYTDGKVVIAYGFTKGTTTGKYSTITGYYKVKISPVGTRGRIRTETTYLNAESKSVKAALGYGIHVDIQTQHEFSKLFSLGNNQGLYFAQPTISDQQPYFLSFHTDGYKQQPVVQFANNKYNSDIWTKIGSSFNSVTDYPEIGKNVQYNLSHPTIGYRWDASSLEAGGTESWSMEQSVSSQLAEDASLETTAKNLTTNDTENNRVDDEIEYSTVVDSATKISNGTLVETLPIGVSKPTEIRMTFPDGTSIPLDVNQVYDENNHTITVYQDAYEAGESTLTYTVKVLKESQGELLKSSATLNGTDIDGEPMVEIQSEYELTIQKFKDITADPKPQIIEKGSDPSNLKAEDFVQNVVAENPTFTFLNQVTDTSEVGVQIVEVEITAPNSNPIIVKVPVVIKDENTVINPDQTRMITGTDFTINRLDIKGNQAYVNDKILSNSTPKAWNITTGELLPVTVQSTTVPIDADVQTAEYKAVLQADGITKEIKITVSGQLTFTVPEVVDFGEVGVTTKIELINRQRLDWAIEVDNSLRSPWSITVQADALKLGNETIKDSLVFVDSNGTEKSLSNAVLIAKEENSSNAKTIVQWGKDRGLLLKTLPGGAKTNKAYESQLTWTLHDTPDGN